MKTKSHFSFGLAPKNQAIENASHTAEWVFLPAGKSLPKPSSKADPRWSETAVKQWTAKLPKPSKEKTKTPKSKASDWQSMQVHFDSGSVYEAHWVSSEKSVYRLHTSLRKAVLGSLTQADRTHFRVDVSMLGEKEAIEIVSAIQLLALMTEWKQPVFGKKLEEQKKSDEKPKAKKIESVVRGAMANPKNWQAMVDRSTVVASGMNSARTLSALPSNELHPPKYLEMIRARAKEHGYQVEFYDYKKLRSLRAGSFCAVIQGSLDQRGGLVHLTYKPKKASKNAKKVAIVGKGLCFDTGGHNLKTGDYMHGMHRDMTGSAVALTLFETVIQLGLPVEAHAYLALAENMISPESYRPNDVVIATDGTSVEVVDTDAEGRMVLADTLAIARKGKPNLTLDFATLTGSAIRAIGTHRCAVFSNDENHLNKAVAAGDASGERVWGFPIGDEFWDALKSEHADVLQCALKAPGDHIYAATFLSHFIGDECPWVHCDLSADTNIGGLGLVPTEGSGFGIRFGLQLIEDCLT